MNSQPVDTAQTALGWVATAACRGRDVNDFFTTERRRVREIKNLCAACPVSQNCLDEAFRAEDTSRYGIFGGLTAEERSKLRRRR